jgi:hypothetical protein
MRPVWRELRTREGVLVLVLFALFAVALKGLILVVMRLLSGEEVSGGLDPGDAKVGGDGIAVAPVERKGKEMGVSGEEGDEGQKGASVRRGAGRDEASGREEIRTSSENEMNEVSTVREATRKRKRRNARSDSGRRSSTEGAETHRLSSGRSKGAPVHW